MRRTLLAGLVMIVSLLFILAGLRLLFFEPVSVFIKIIGGLISLFFFILFRYSGIIFFNAVPFFLVKNRFEIYTLKNKKIIGQYVEYRGDLFLIEDEEVKHYVKFKNIKEIHLVTNEGREKFSPKEFTLRYPKK